MSKLIIDFEDKFDFEELMSWLEEFKEKSKDPGMIKGYELVSYLLPAYIPKD